jgi:hypothetical protein
MSKKRSSGRRQSVGSVVVAALEVVEDSAVANRKELRDALYAGIFHKYRKTILIVGSFLRMLRRGDGHYDAIK